jgi:hypothetical protein
MRTRQVRARLVLGIVFGACFFAAASSAMATVSIEPLNTKFTGKGLNGPEWELSPNLFVGCSSFAASGTSNSTKSNNVSLTPTIASCHYSIGEARKTMTVANSCHTEGTSAWTLVFAGSAPKGAGSIKLNCSTVLTLGSCVITAAEQTTTETAISWKNSGTSAIDVSADPTFQATVNKACKEGILELSNGPIRLSSSFELEGIHAT